MALRGGQRGQKDVTMIACLNIRLRTGNERSTNFIPFLFSKNNSELQFHAPMMRLLSQLDRHLD
jgi:hypothetical protein